MKVESRKQKVETGASVVRWIGGSVDQCFGAPVLRCLGASVDRLTDIPKYRNTDSPIHRHTDTPTHRFTALYLLLGAGLLGLMLTGCKPSSSDSAKSQGTNAVAARPQAGIKSNPAAGPLPRNLPPGNLPPRSLPPNQVASARPGAKPGQPVAVVPPPPRTNLAPPALRSRGMTNALAAGARTNAPAGPRSAGAKAWAGLLDKIKPLRGSPYFYPAATVAVLCLVFGIIFLVQFLKAKSAKRGQPCPADATPKATRQSVSQEGPEGPDSFLQRLAGDRRGAALVAILGAGAGIRPEPRTDQSRGRPIAGQRCCQGLA